MLIVKHTEATTAPAHVIWKIWADVENWNSWDHAIEYSRLEGPFAIGTTGVLKPKGASPVRMHITALEHNKSFVDEAKLPLAKIIVSHFMTESAGKTQVTHQIEMTGPLAFFFAIIIGRGMKKDLPVEMKSMIKKAEKMHAGV